MNDEIRESQGEAGFRAIVEGPLEVDCQAIRSRRELPQRIEILMGHLVGGGKNCRPQYSHSTRRGRISRMEYPKLIPASDPLPAGVHVLAHEQGKGWWQAAFFPDDASAV
jgi:hypothetical protein